MMPSEPATAAEANARAIELRAQGRVTEAIAVFRAAIARFPRVPALRQNLAQLLYETGDAPGAIGEHEGVLADEPGDLTSNLALSELLQMTGDRERALAHQRRVLETRRLFSSAAPNERRRVLVLCAPGDWQANIPVDFLFDRTSTTVHKLYLLDTPRLLAEAIPEHDVIWNTIAESPDALPYLALADLVARAAQRPFLNLSARVLATARMQLGETLRATGAVVAPIAERSREALAHGEVPFAFPIIVRPVGSHAGHGLERLDTAAQCAAYTERAPSDAYYASPFVDYRSADGYYRKYRVVFVDGEPFAVHLAISPNWMIHYYNAPMAENAWMRDEEARFLADVHGVFDGARAAALREIASAVGLEYFGIDCTIAPDGRVLVFEADPAMLVHTSDPIERYPYKHRYIPRIYRAVEQMIDRRKAADT